ncbi:MAG: magnesium transporter CorA family protein [Gaiellales bacterium]
MAESLRSTQGGWHEHELEDGSIWIDVTDPLHPRLHELEDRFGFHPLAVEDARSETQRPKLDRYGDVMFIVLHVPQPHGGSGLDAWELNAFLGPDVLVTVSIGRRDTRVGGGAAERLSERELPPVHARLYTVMCEAFSACEPLLDQVAAGLAQLDRTLSEADDARREQIVGELSELKQRIISYRRIIGPDRQVLAAMEALPIDAGQADFGAYVSDVGDTVERAWSQLEGFKEVAEALEDTNESYISHRQNAVLQRLTVFSVLVLPMALVSGILGMNVGGIPLQHTSAGFWIVLAALIAAQIALTVIFKLRNWI